MFAGAQVLLMALSRPWGDRGRFTAHDPERTYPSFRSWVRALKRQRSDMMPQPVQKQIDRWGDRPAFQRDNGHRKARTR